MVLAVPGEFDDILNVAENRPGAYSDRFARLRQNDPRPAALDKLDTEPGFKFAKLPAQGRLGDIGQLGRFAEVKGFGDSDKVAELLEGGNNEAPVQADGEERKLLSKSRITSLSSIRNSSR